MRIPTRWWKVLVSETAPSAADEAAAPLERK